MHRAPLLEWLASLTPDRRDAAIEARLVIDAAGLAAGHVDPPGEHLLGYHAAGVAPIVRALLDVPVTAEDTLVDLGSGLGKVVLLTRILTGATARGVELQPALVQRAQAAAARLGVDVRFTCEDARHAEIGDGTVFFLYTPFTGPVLADVMARLHDVARTRPIVVCALGIDLERVAPWLAPRATDAFWLTLYDSAMPGVARRPSPPAHVDAIAEAIARECDGSSLRERA